MFEPAYFTAGLPIFKECFTSIGNFDRNVIFLIHTTLDCCVFVVVIAILLEEYFSDRIFGKE